MSEDLSKLNRLIKDSELSGRYLDIAYCRAVGINYDKFVAERTKIQVAREKWFAENPIPEVYGDSDVLQE
jgi:hypothetical protein